MNTVRVAAGFAIAFLIGAGARWFRIPVPAPPTFIGAFLIVAMTAGWIVTDTYFTAEDKSPNNSTPVVESQLKDSDQ
ncbi:MAG: DUF1427 family protein [bacterium]